MMSERSRREVHSRLMQDISSAHQPMCDLIARRPVAYLDIPVHDNIGDILIMLGTMDFFKNNRIPVSHIASAFNFHRGAIDDRHVIVFHGGGNFGDLYAVHQEFREKVIGEFKRNTIIVLPQTIHFESETRYRNCCQILKQHSDLHIFVRDKRSFELARAMSGHVYLAPDMAHHLYPIEMPGDPKKKLLLISRSDREASGREESCQPDAVTDWPELLRPYQRAVGFHIRLQKGLTKLRMGRLTASLTSMAWMRLAEKLAAVAVKEFAGFEEVCTSRLHGHILACLMDKPNYVMDNSYGKNAAYMEAWTGKSPLVRPAK